MHPLPFAFITITDAKGIIVKFHKIVYENLDFYSIANIKFCF